MISKALLRLTPAPLLWAVAGVSVSPDQSTSFRAFYKHHLRIDPLYLSGPRNMSQFKEYEGDWKNTLKKDLDIYRIIVKGELSMN